MGLLRRKDKLSPLPPLPEIPRSVTSETTTIENVKAKMDLVLSRMESLMTEQEVLNQKIVNIERMVKELYAMAKS